MQVGEMLTIQYGVPINVFRCDKVLCSVAAPPKSAKNKTDYDD